MSLPQEYTVQMTGLRGPGGEVTTDLAALEANVVAKAAAADTSAGIATAQAAIATSAASSYVVGWNGAAPIIDRANARMKFPTGYFRQRGAGSNTNIAAQNVAWPAIGTANTYYLDTADATIKVLGSGLVPAVGNQLVILGIFWNGTWTPINTPAAIDSEGSLLNVTSFAWSNEVLVDLNDTLLSGAPSIYVPLYPRYTLPGGGLNNSPVTNTPVFTFFGGYCRIAVSTAVTQQVVWWDPGDNTVKLATNPTKPQATGTLPGVRIIEFTGTEETIRAPMGVKWRSLGKRQQSNKASLKARLRSENHSVVLAHIGDSNTVAEGADSVDTLTIPASAPYTVKLPVYGQRGFTSVVANGTTLTRAAAGAAPTANQYQSSDWAAVNDQKGRTLTFDVSRAGQTVVVTYNPEIAPRGQNIRDMRYPRSTKSWVRQMGRQMASIASGSQNEAFVSKTESLTVASGAVTLAYCPAPDTLTISGYTEIFGPAAPAANEFKLSTSTPGQLIFNAAANGATLSITYGIAAAVRYYRDNPVGTATATGVAATSIFTTMDAYGLKQAASVLVNTGSAYGAMMQVAPNALGSSIAFDFTGDRFDITHAKYSDGIETWDVEVDGTVVQTVNMNVDGTTAFGHVTSITGLTFGYHRVRLIQRSSGSNLRVEAITFRKYFEHWNLASYGSNTIQWTSGAANGLLAAGLPSYVTDYLCMIGTNDRASTGTTGRGAQITKYGLRNIIPWIGTNRARARGIMILPPKAFGTSDIYGNAGFYSSSDDIARAAQEIADEFGLDTLSYYDVTARYEIENGSVPSTEGWPNGLHFQQPIHTEVAKAFMREFS